MVAKAGGIVPQLKAFVNSPTGPKTTHFWWVNPSFPSCAVAWQILMRCRMASNSATVLRLLMRKSSPTAGALSRIGVSE